MQAASGASEDSDWRKTDLAHLKDDIALVEGGARYILTPTTAPIKEGILGVQMMGLVIFSGKGTPIIASPAHYQPTKGKVSPDSEVASPQEGVRKEFVTEAWNKVFLNTVVSKTWESLEKEQLTERGCQGMLRHHARNLKTWSKRHQCGNERARSSGKLVMADLEKRLRGPGQGWFGPATSMQWAGERRWGVTKEGHPYLSGLKVHSLEMVNVNANVHHPHQDEAPQ
ncbi:hypothetical protein BDN67DRAFT_983027 [Paxillus ammoniavirescens]|nr:hypothetical protein BDN67DRAFT_983027 [Paxillus ammoniavirescens]